MPGTPEDTRAPDERPVAVLGGRCVLPDGVRDDVAVLCRGGTIADIVPPDRVPAQAERVDVAGRLVTPGLIDLHTHGALGLSFGTADADVYDRLRAYLAAQGVTAAQASLVSGPVDELEGVLRFVASAYRPAPGCRLLGVHLEGPFIAVDQCGAHDPAMLRAPHSGDADRLVPHAGTLRMITIAPELDGAVELTRRLSAAGVVVAIGHSSARAEQVGAAIAAGARHLTHLWSGMSTLHREGPWRVPGLIDEALASDDVTAEIIADGRHLPPTLLTIARRCLPGRLCVVSDATAGAGLPEGSRYRAGTVECEVRDGVGIVVGADAFGGSTTPVNRMLAHLVDDLNWPLPEAMAMVTAVPARVLGLERTGALVPGHVADLAVFDPGFGAWATMVDGRWVHGPRH